MSAPDPPSRILLATDMSHRTDRALDRAVQLAREWRASLLVVHAIEEEVNEAYDRWSRYEVPSWRRGPDPAIMVREQLRRDLVDAGEGIDLQVHVEDGAPVEVVLRAAERDGSELIITGVARAETLGRLWLGSTVDRLVRQSPDPLLIVRDRTFGPYHQLVVTTDFSPSARIALETAAGYFPKAQFHLFHAYDVPFASYLGRDQVDHELQAFGAEAADAFLAETDLGAIDPNSIDRLMEHGSPATLLRDFAKSSHRHLVVVGSHGGGILYDALIGSTARRIIDAVPGDVLLVPDRSKREAQRAADE